MNITSEGANELLDLFSSAVADQAICLVDHLGNIRSWNTGAGNFYQYSTEEVLDSPVSGLFNGLDSASYLEQAFADGKISFEHEVKRKDGSTLPAYLTLQSIYTAGKLQRFALLAQSLAYTRKIDYRFDHTYETIDRPGLFQQLIGNSYSGITLFDADLNFIYRSPSAARITGYNDRARTNVTFKDIIHPADRARIKTILDDLIQRPGESITCRLKSRHYLGHFIDLEGIFTNWLDEPQIGALVLNFHDVTDHQHTEDMLKQTIEELSAYKYALDTAAIVAITDQKGIIRHVNANFCTISGYSEHELIGQDHRIINSGYHDRSFIKQMWRTIGNGKVWRGDFCNLRKDGSQYWVDTTIIPFLNKHGKPYQYVAIRFDRTDAKIAKQELIKKNDQINSLLESINDGFIALDQELRYTYVNKRTCKMVGLSSAAMLGKNIWDLFPGAIGSSTWSAVEEALSTGLPITNEDYYAPLNLWQENHIYPTDNGLSIFISDISWRKREEEQKALLADISKIFEQSSALTELMQQVMLRLTMISDSFCLAETWLIDRNGRQIVLSAQMAVDEITSGFFKERPDFFQLEFGKGLPGRTWAAGEIEFWTDLKSHPDFLRREAAANAGLSSAFGVPLRYNDRLIGVLLLGQTRTERPDHLSDGLLKRLGDHLGSAISRRQLENDLHDIFENTPDIICIIGTNRYFKKVNPAMCTLLGYSETELLAIKIDDLVHMDDLKDSQERMRTFIDDELSSVYFENRFRHRNGNIIYLAWTVAKGKERDILFCVAKNISDKMTLEQLLHKASHLARIGSWEINLETGQIIWPEVTAEIMGLSSDFKPFRNNISSLFTTADWKKMDSALILASERGPAFDLEFEITTEKKQRRWVRILGEGEFDTEKCIRIYGSVQDIDARKRAEHAATALLLERNSILESIGDAFFSMDRDWNIQYWNHVAEQVLQKPKNQILGKNLWNVFKSAVGSPSYHQYHEAVKTGESRHFEDYYSAENRWYDVSAYPSEGGLSVFFKDITERKLAERELQRQAEALEISRQNYSDLFQLSPLPKFVFDIETLAYLDVNRAAVSHYGYSRAEFLSMTIRDIRPETELPLLEQVIEDARRKPYFYQPGTFIHRKKNGDLINVEITSSAIEFDGKMARIALAVDVTEHLRHMSAIQLQNQQLREIAWMQSHTIRSPLARIMGLIELLNNISSDAEEITDILKYIQSSAIELDTVIHSISYSAKADDFFN